MIKFLLKRPFLFIRNLLVSITSLTTKGVLGFLLKLLKYSALIYVTISAIFSYFFGLNLAEYLAWSNIIMFAFLGSIQSKINRWIELLNEFLGSPTPKVEPKKRKWWNIFSRGEKPSIVPTPTGAPSPTPITTPRFPPTGGVGPGLGGNTPSWDSVIKGLNIFKKYKEEYPNPIPKSPLHNPDLMTKLAKSFLDPEVKKDQVWFNPLTAYPVTSALIGAMLIGLASCYFSGVDLSQASKVVAAGITSGCSVGWNSISTISSTVWNKSFDTFSFLKGKLVGTVTVQSVDPEIGQGPTQRFNSDEINPPAIEDMSNDEKLAYRTKLQGKIAGYNRDLHANDNPDTDLDLREALSFTEKQLRLLNLQIPESLNVPLVSSSPSSSSSSTATIVPPVSSEWEGSLSPASPEGKARLAQERLAVPLQRGSSGSSLGSSAFSTPPVEIGTLDSDKGKAPEARAESNQGLGLNTAVTMGITSHLSSPFSNLINFQVGPPVEADQAADNNSSTSEENISKFNTPLSKSSSLLPWIITFFAKLKTKTLKGKNKVPKEMEILAPKRYIRLTADEITSYDLHHLELLRVMSEEEISSKVSLQELIYYCELFILLDEDIPHNVKIVLDKI